MTIYLDVVLLLNVVFNGMILFLTRYLIRSTISMKRIMIGTVIATLIVPIQLYFPSTFLTSAWIKLLYSISIILVTFGWRGLLTLCKTVAIFYFITFSIGGGLLGIHFLIEDMFLYTNNKLLLTAQNMYGEEIHLLFVVICFPILWIFTKGRMDGHVTDKIKYDQFYEVVLTLNGQSMKTTGYLDSGNHLIDPITRRPVVICDASFLGKFFTTKDWKGLLNSIENDDYATIPTILEQKVFVVPFQGVGGATNYLYCIKPEMITIFYEGKLLESSHVLIGVQLQSLTENGDYHCLLHPQLVHFSTINSA